MSAVPVIAPPTPSTAAPSVSGSRLKAHLVPAAIFCAWCALALWLIAGHEMWRDEVRALSFAIDPPTVWAMLDGLRGEGHPALWYLILRAGHSLTGSMLVLPVAAFLAAAAGMALLLWRAPFHPLLKVLLAGSAFLAIEYPVVARNYGISLLPIFVFAAKYDSWRQRGIGLGISLAVLANTNVHSAIVAIALLGIWWIETVQENGFVWAKPWRVYVVNAAIAGAGLVLAALIVRGPANDAISSSLPQGDLSDALWAVVNPGAPFWSLAENWPAWALSLLLFGSILSFAGRPALVLTALGALWLLSIFFVLGYPAFYRHASVWLLLLIALSWIAEERRLRQEPSQIGLWTSLGQLFFCGLLALQVLSTVAIAASSKTRPWSNSKRAAAILKADPRLGDAIVVSEQDFLLEPLRYYGIERTYLLREQRFGRTVNFTRQARLALGLGEILADARRLKREFGSEVVVLISEESALDPAAPARSLRVGYNWRFTTTPEEVASFLDGTERLATLTSSLQREDYTLYRVK